MGTLEVMAVEYYEPGWYNNHPYLLRLRITTLSTNHDVSHPVYLLLSGPWPAFLSRGTNHPP